MGKENRPGIYLETDTGTGISILLVGADGRTERINKGTPAEDLVTFTDLEFSYYHSAIQQLWDEHPLFEERSPVPVSDYEDFELRAIQIMKLLRAIDPVAYFRVSQQMAEALALEDDGSPIFPSEKGAAILRVLDEPVRAQRRIINMFEIGFADFERDTQQARFHALEAVWPGLVDRYFQVRTLPDQDGDRPIGTRCRYALSGLFDLYLLELSLYFRQEKQRIVRCDSCWRYFIPRTKAETLYCERTIDGSSCKKLGPVLRRRANAELDTALRLYDRMRRKLEARVERYENAAPWERERLMDFGYEQYADWLEMARQARTNYLDGCLSTEDFLRQIDTFGELNSYDAEKLILAEPGSTTWRKRIKSDIDFDPEKEFLPMDVLDFNVENPQWVIVSSEEQILEAKGGHESLRDKYGQSDIHGRKH